MKYDLNIYELGQLLTKISEDYSVNVLAKSKLSGGWISFMTYLFPHYFKTKSSYIM